MPSLQNSLESLARSAVLMIVGSVLGKGIGLIGETLVIRSLDPALYGRVSLAYTIVFSAGNVLLLGINQGVTKISSEKRNEGEKLEVIIAGTISAALSGGVGLFLLLLLPGTIFTLLPVPDIGLYVILLSPYVVVYPLSMVAIAVLRSQERTVATVVSQVGFGRVVALFALLFAIELGLNGKIGVVFWLTKPSVILIVAGIIVIRSVDHSTIGLPEASVFRNLLTFSWPLAVGSIIFIFLSKLDVLMIGFFLNSEEVGLYRAIQPLSQSATIFIGSFNFLFLPLATKFYQSGDFESLSRIYNSAVKWTVVLTLPIVAVFIIKSREIITVLYGEVYLSSAIPLVILTVGLFGRTIVGPNAELLKAINQPKVELYGAVVGLIINFSLNIFLIPIYGIGGAAVATVIGFAVYNIIEVAVLYNEIGVFPLSLNIIKPILGTVILVVGTDSLFNFQSPVVEVIVVAAVIFITVPVSVIITGSVEPSDIVLLDRLESNLGRDLSTVRWILNKGNSGGYDSFE
jgi:O-antigen/teichoic acid export membrane protein